MADDEGYADAEKRFGSRAENHKAAQAVIQRLLVPLVSSMCAASLVCTAIPAAATAQTLRPGSAVVVYGDAENTNMRCTAGFVVRNVNRVPLMFTAGHCDVGEQVMMRSGESGRDVQVGEMVVSQFQGSSGEDDDIAVMRPAATTALVSDVDGVMVAGVLPLVYQGLTLCMLGGTTGRSCGPVIDFTKSKVRFGARIDGGDSGGPVWAMHEDGYALAVGILIRESGDGFPVAEMLAPWMRRYNLDITLDQTEWPAEPFTGQKVSNQSSNE